MLYFDNAATTKPDEQVLRRMDEAQRECYGNASSRHAPGRQSREIIEKTRKELQAHFHLPDAAVVFTSCATEANNLLLFSVRQNYLKGSKAPNVVTTKIEHPSVYEAVRHWFGDKSAKIRYIQTDVKGNIDTAHYQSLIDENTALVSINHVNNELGTKNDIAALARLAKEAGGEVIFHSDIVQGAGKFAYDLKDTDIDAVTLSAHKFHGPKGIGALVTKGGLRLYPLCYGGEQEDGLRPGTENVAAIEGLRAALAMAKPTIGNDEQIWQMNHLIRTGLESNMKHIRFNTPQAHEKASPYILNLTINGCKGEVLSRMLDEEGICISTSSACSSKKKVSRVLTEAGMSREDAQNSVRISLSRHTTEQECQKLVAALAQNAERLRKISKFTK